MSILEVRGDWGDTQDLAVTSRGSGPHLLREPARVAVVGLGYVGLPTSLSLCAKGIEVIGLDVDQRRLDAIRRGDVDLSPTDQDRLDGTARTGLLTLTDQPGALQDASHVVICVPTPIDEHLVPDLRPLTAACDTVVQHAVPGQTIILTSTSYVGTTRDLLVRPLTRRGFTVGDDVHVAFSPERIDPGVTGHSPEQTPRVVGGHTWECATAAMAVLRSTCRDLHPVTTPEIAELAKLLENTFRAVNIALANEMADLARVLDLPIMEVIEAAATKPYGFMPFFPGPGVGGHCIPCDPHYLLWQLRRRLTNAPLIEAAMTKIATRPKRVVERVREVLAARGRSVTGATVHVWGVAYKPGVADVRESPALPVIADLQRAGATVSFSDAMVGELVVAGQRLAGSKPAAAGRADLVVVMTVHPDEDLTPVDRHPCVLDATFRLPAADAVETL